MQNRLADEVAIVTGSTRSIGKEIALLFARHGASVVVTGRDVEAGAAVEKEIRGAGGEAMFVRADLGVEGAGDELVNEAVRRFGKVSVVVNNAAGTELIRQGRDHALSESTDDEWLRAFDINLLGVVRVTRPALRVMMSGGGGSIVNISSYVAARGNPGTDAYTASKGALNALTASLAVEYGAWNIRCNALQLGLVLHNQASVAEMGLSEETVRQLSAMHVIRPVTAQDAAMTALFLASRESGAITGAILPVDAGAAAKGLLPWLTPIPSV